MKYLNKPSNEDLHNNLQMCQKRKNSSTKCHLGPFLLKTILNSYDKMK